MSLLDSWSSQWLSTQSKRTSLQSPVRPHLTCFAPFNSQTTSPSPFPSLLSLWLQPWFSWLFLPHQHLPSSGPLYSLVVHYVNTHARSPTSLTLSHYSKVIFSGKLSTHMHTLPPFLVYLPP